MFTGMEDNPLNSSKKSLPMNDSNLPGRLGNPEMLLATDPRTDRRLLAELKKFGMDGIPQTPPPTEDISYEDCLALARLAEDGQQLFLDALFANVEEIPCQRSEIRITGEDGNTIVLYIHRPPDHSGPLPCLIHIHGGGMVLFSAADANYRRWRDELAAKGMLVIGVEYRTAGGAMGINPFPAGLNDCVAATRWAYANREELGASHIVLSGESGGANLSCATAIKAAQEGWIEEISGVYAMCPYISGLYANPPSSLLSMRENDNYILNVRGLSSLVKLYDPGNANALNPLAWPYHAQAKDLHGLPPHAISVNQLDPLRDEGLVYHQNLLAAGVSSISRTVNGTCHGSDCLAPHVMPDVYQATLRDIAGFARALQ